MKVSEKKCCICNGNNVGEYAIINHKKYHIYCIVDLKRRVDEAIEHIERNLQFCENDSQGAYDVCNIRIASDRKLLKTLKGSDIK